MSILRHSYLLCLSVSASFTFGIQKSLAANPTFDRLAPEWSDALNILEQVDPQMDPDRLRENVIRSMVQTYDSQGQILNQSQVDRLNRNRQGDMLKTGVLVDLVDGKFTVREIPPGSDALRAGIRMDMELLKIGDDSVDQLSLLEVSDRLNRAESAEPLQLTFNDQGASKIVSVNPGMTPSDVFDRREEWPENIVYCRINGMYPGAAKSLLTQFQQWKAKAGILLDLRGANGGDTESVARLASLFAPADKPLFAFYNRAGDLEETVRSSGGEAQDAPVIVLLNGQTTGASELLAATLANSCRGVMLVGQPTTGDLALRSTVPLNSESWLYLVTRKVRFGNGTTFDGSEGIHPDVEINAESPPTTSRSKAFVLEMEKPSSRDAEAKTNLFLHQRVANDPVLHRAVDILLGIKALNIRTVPENAHAPAR